MLSLGRAGTQVFVSSAAPLALGSRTASRTSAVSRVPLFHSSSVMSSRAFAARGVAAHVRAQTGLTMPAALCLPRDNAFAVADVAAPLPRMFAASRTLLAPATKKPAASKASRASAATAADDEDGLQYQKLSQREHILARPEPYLGSTDAVSELHWVLVEPAAQASAGDPSAAAGAGTDTIPSAPGAGGVVGTEPSLSLSASQLPSGKLPKLTSVKALAASKVIEVPITYVPALYKIFDEILVNAADNIHRGSASAPSGGKGKGVAADVATTMSYVDVTISPSDGTVSICNDGAAIPIVMHPKEKCYVPELIFGHLLTSSNYDDTVTRFTGGRHGFGAKLTNIFSSRFTVEITDAARKLQYSQTFERNMSVAQPAVISPAPAGTVRNSTRITFTPDLPRFLPAAVVKTGLPADTLRLMRRRVVDVAAALGPAGVIVSLDGVKVPVKSFADYLAMAPAFAGNGNSEAGDGTESDTEAGAGAGAASAAAGRKGKLTMSQVDSHWLVAVGPRQDEHALAALPPRAAAAAAAATAAAGVVRQMSFVNGIATSRGGTHVGFVLDQVTRHLAEYLNEPRRRKKFGLDEATEIPLGLVRAHIAVLVSCLVPNPSFDSQTKDMLLTPIRLEGRRPPAGAKESVVGPTLPTKLLDRIARTSGVVEAVAETLLMRQVRDQRRKLNATLGRGAKTGRKQHLNIDKLDDANLAGTERGHECTLILTEGDSAKALALSGLAVVGRERFGVFPLRGKLLNVRDAATTAVEKNKELSDVAAILGLRFGVDYSSPEARHGLRYGRVMLMADQDHDGSHIKGLFLNIIDCFWPSLLQSEGFLSEFITPIVKATRVSAKESSSFVLSRAGSDGSGAAAAAPKKGKGNTDTLSFYSLPTYFKWKESLTATEARKWRIKYYKGLGTSTAAEGREYFSQLGAHAITFVHDGDDAAAALDLAFNKKKADERKEWLLTEGLDEAGDEIVPHVEEGRLDITEFVNRELVHFSRADTVRSIPSLMDGLKPGQRKVLYACFKRGLTREIKVAQLAGYVSEHTGYHHGEQSLNSTIVNMAQDFVFSNNLPLLAPVGQFGTRHMGGKDAASPRYIFTKLQPYTRLIFRQEDDAVLQYRDDDGDPVEPYYFAPIIPTVLCNGSEGIGTGFSTSVPTYHPLHVIAALRASLAPGQFEEPEPLLPWAWGFKGTVQPDEGDGFRVLTEGKGAIIDKNTVEITELPWGVWNSAYKAFLCSLFDAKTLGAGAGGDDLPANTSGFTIQSFTEHHTEDSVCFRVKLSPDHMDTVRSLGISAAFKLTTSLLTSNMHLFDSAGKISLFDAPEDVIAAYLPVRLALYGTRKAHQLAALSADAARADDRARFISLVISGDLVLARRKRADIVAELVALGLRPVRKETPASAAAAADASAAAAAAAAAGGDSAAGVDDAVIVPSSGGKTTVKTGKGAASTKNAAVDTVVVDSSDADGAVRLSDYDYLLNMPLSSLTAERVAALTAEVAALHSAIAELTASTPQQLWLRELAELEGVLRGQLRMPGYLEYLAEQAAKPAPVLGKGIVKRKAAASAAKGAAKTATKGRKKA